MNRNIVDITDINSAELDIYARLSEPQLVHINEPDKGIFIAESPNVILRAIDAGYEALSVLVNRNQINNDADCVLNRLDNQIPIFAAGMDVLTNITGFQLTRGLLCAMRRKEISPIEEICKNTRNIAVLEGVVNPTNVGAIFRSAAALNVDAIILSPDCSDPLYRRAARVSMGTVFQIPWTYACTTTAEWYENGINLIHSLGFCTIGMALTDNSLPISSEVFRDKDKKAILFGAEGCGLARSTMDKCNYTVKIPMSHNVDSLNVAAASAVTFWELCNK